MRHGQLIQLHPVARIEELSDEGLVAACATGDRAAQGLLFERHVDAVHRYIARMRGADSAVVDDLVQATFIAAFRSARSFRGPRLASWLYGIATNIVRTHVRSDLARKRAVTSLSEQRDGAVAAPHDADVVKLRTAIAALPPKLRAVLVLVDLEGETGADAAAALRIPEGTLWRQLSDARKRLREALEDKS